MIATLAAGSRQQSRFLALMENYDRTIELIETAQNSAGRSNEQFAKYADSVENKINRLKNTWEQFRINLIPEKAYKQGIDALNNFISRFKNIKLIDVGVITTWGIIVGKQLINGIINSVKNSSNLLATGIEQTILKVKTNGTSRIDIQTNIDEITPKIRGLEAEIEALKEKGRVLAFDIGTLSATTASYETLEQELNALGLTLDSTDARFKYLDLSSNEWQNDLNLLAAKAQELGIDLTALKTKLNDSSTAFKENTASIQQAGTQLEGYRSKVNQLNSALKSSKSWSIIGSTLGSALGTAAMTAFTGTFNIEETTKMIGVQAAVAGINATTSALSQAISGAATFGAAGGPVGLAITGIGLLTTILLPKWIKQIKERREEEERATNEVLRTQYAYEQTAEEAKKLAEELDEVNQRFEKIEDKWTSVNEASKKYKELKQKIVLTEEEQEELNKATETLAEQMPELVSYYDDQNNAIILINENYEKQIQLQKENYLWEKKRNDLATGQSISKNIDELNDKYEAYQAKIKEGLGFNFSITDVNGQPQNYSFNLLDDYKKIIKTMTQSNALLNSDVTGKFLLESINQVRGTSYSWGQKNLYENLTAYDENTIQEITDVYIEKYKQYLAETSDDFDLKFLETYSTEREHALKDLSLNLKNYANDIFEETLMSYDSSERKDMISSVLNNILLQDEEILKDYEEKSQREDFNFNNWLNEALNDEKLKENAEHYANEIESLSTDLYEKLTLFYGQLSSLSKEERNDIIELFSGYDFVSDLEQKSEAQQKAINKKIFDYGNIYGIKNKNGTTNERTNNALAQLQEISEVVIDQILLNAASISKKYGEESGIQYIEAFNQVIKKYNLSDAAENYLASIDWSQINFLNEDSQIKTIADNLVKIYDVAEDSAEQVVRDFISDAKKDNLGIVVKISSEADIDSIKTSAQTAYDILKDNLENFTVIYSAEVDQNSIKVTREQYEDIYNAIKSMNEAEDSPYSIDINKYLGYNKKTNEYYIKSLKELREELEGPIGGLEKLQEQYKKLKEEGADESLLTSMKGLINYFAMMNGYVDDFTDKAREAAKTFKDLAKTIDSLSSNYQSIISEQEENGFLSANSLESLTENIEEINDELEELKLSKEKLDISSILSRNEKGFYANTTALRAFIVNIIAAARAEGKLTEELDRQLQAILDDLNAYDRKRLEEAQKKAEEEHQKEVEELEKAAEEAEKAAEDAQKEMESAAEEAQKAQEEIQKAEEALKEAQDKVKEAYDDIEEKQKKVIELQEQLNELMYGTGGRRKSTLDGMYNYDQLLKQLNNDLEDVKSTLESPMPGDDIEGAVAQYGQLMHNKKVNLLSQQAIYQSSLNSAKGVLAEYSAYYTEVNGRLLVDVAKLNAAALPDKIKDQIEATVSSYNDAVDKIHDISNQIQSLEKEFLDFQKTYRDKYINLQEKVINTLKSQAQEELNTQKEKYAALAEADDEYVNALEEAIKKQRELRQQEQDINDLSQKEKKLSLLQRDTSGTKKKEILKQQKDVEKTRQSIVDKSVDNLINNLKELYKNQKESRDAETKYMESVLENATYIEEANAVISSWQTADDMIAWFYENSQEVQNMTNEQLEQYSEELEEMYNAREIYMNVSMEDFTNMLEVQQDEILQVTTTTAEHLTSEAERAFDEVKREVDEAIEKAKKDIEEAMDAVEEAKENLKKALDEVAEKLKAVEEAHNAAAAAADKEREASEAAQKAALAAAAASEEAAKKASEIPQANNGMNNTGETGSPEYSKGQDDNLSDIANQTSNAAAAQFQIGETVNQQQQQKTEVNKMIESFNNMDKLQSQDYTISKHKPDNMTKQEFLTAIKNGLNSDKILYVYPDREGATKLRVYKTSDPGWSSTAPYLSSANWNAYKKGGLVNYTGPAWVDGTPANPEAFLNADDTRNIARLTDVLGALYSSMNNFSNFSQTVSNQTIINVSVDVAGINSDYDVDSAIEKVKRSIVEAANRVGSTVILHQ